MSRKHLDEGTLSIASRRVERPDTADMRPGKRLVLIDDCILTRECIVAALAGLSAPWEIVCASRIDDFLRDGRPADVLVIHINELRDLDYHLSTPSEDVDEVCKLFPTVVMSATEDADHVHALLERGVRGYVSTRSTSIHLLVEIIRLVSAGGVFVPPSAFHLRPAEALTPAIHGLYAQKFTSREREVFELLKHGKANKHIAHELQMSESTVKSHIQKIMRKLKATNRTEAVSRVFNGSGSGSG